MIYIYVVFWAFFLLKMFVVQNTIQTKFNMSDSYCILFEYPIHVFLISLHYKCMGKSYINII